MYRVVACGVNNGLSFAEKDAADVAAHFRGALGPPSDQVVLLQGEAASASAIEAAIHMARFTKPQFLVVYFSGHGNRGGVQAADGQLGFDTLIAALRFANVPYTTVILDTCYAASYLGFLKEAQVGGLAGPPDLTLAWLDALAQATPGTRLMFSTGGNRLSGESGDLQGGVFTQCLLAALQGARGDIQIANTTWISDQRAFRVARRVIAALGSPQIPVERGLTGDFPLALSQADEPVGSANFVRTAIESGTLSVSFEIDERRNVQTRVKWRLLNASGDEIASQADALVPSDSAMIYRGRIACPHEAVRADLVTRLLRAKNGEAPLEWVLELEDELGHPLDQKTVPARYRW